MESGVAQSRLIGPGLARAKAPPGAQVYAFDSIGEDVANHVTPILVHPHHGSSVDCKALVLTTATQEAD